MQKIIPFLWFDKEAREAARLYVTSLEDSKIKGITTIGNTPSGKTETVSIELCGQEFNLMNAGPFFKFNPSISFLAACNTKAEVDNIWNKLSKGGSILMELSSYPFSERYGWLQDKYGLSWQIMFTGGKKARQKITPTLMFVGNVCGRAEEAVKFYVSVFKKSKVGSIFRYTTGQEPEREGGIAHAAFTIEKQGFAAMESANKHEFAFNEAISFVVNCQTQKEIDYYWKRLSHVPKAEQCGWLKDKFGVSWQIVPKILPKMLGDKDKKKVARVREAFLKMKKFNIAKLKQAYKGD